MGFWWWERKINPSLETDLLSHNISETTTSVRLFLDLWSTNPWSQHSLNLILRGNNNVGIYKTFQHIRKCANLETNKPATSSWMKPNNQLLFLGWQLLFLHLLSPTQWIRVSTKNWYPKETKNCQSWWD